MKKNKHTASTDFKISTINKAEKTAPESGNVDKNNSNKATTLPISSIKYNNGNSSSQKNLFDKSSKINLNNKSPVFVSSMTELNPSSNVRKNTANNNNNGISKIKNDSSNLKNKNKIDKSTPKIQIEKEIKYEAANLNNISKSKNKITSKSKIPKNYNTTGIMVAKKTNFSELKKERNDMSKIEKEINDKFFNLNKENFSNSSHENFGRNSKFVYELQKDLKTIEMDEGFFSKTSEKAKIISYFTDKSSCSNPEGEKDVSLSYNLDLDKTDIIDDSGVNVQKMYETSQILMSRMNPEEDSCKNLKIEAKEIDEMNKKDKIINDDHIDDEYKNKIFSIKMSPEKNLKIVSENLNIIDFSEKGKFSSSKSPDNMDREYTFNGTMKRGNRLCTKNENIEQVLTKQSSEISLKDKFRISKENKDTNEEDSITNKYMTSQNNLRTSNNPLIINEHRGQENYNKKNLKNHSLTNIVEDTKESHESSCFSNGGNFGITDINNVEVRSYIFNNDNKTEEIKNLENISNTNANSESNFKNIHEFKNFNLTQEPDTFPQEEISNIAIEHSNFVSNDGYSKMLTYEKCVEVLNKKPTQIEEQITNKYENIEDNTLQKEKYVLINAIDTQNLYLTGPMSIKNNLKENLRDNMRGFNLYEKISPINEKESELNNSIEKKNIQFFDKFIKLDNNKDHKIGINKKSENFVCSNKEKDIMNKTDKNDELNENKDCKPQYNLYNIERSINLQISNKTENGSINETDDLLQENSFNNLKNVYMINDRILEIQDPNISFEPLSKNILAGVSELDKNTSYNSRSQNIENFFEFFSQTLSIIYFIFFIILILKTLIISDPFIIISMIFSTGNVFHRFKISGFISELNEMNFEILNLFLLTIILIMGNTSMCETQIYQILHATSFFNFFSFILLFSYVIRIVFLYKNPREVSNKLLLEKLL